MFACGCVCVVTYRCVVFTCFFIAFSDNYNICHKQCINNKRLFIFSLGHERQA